MIQTVNDNTVSDIIDCLVHASVYDHHIIHIYHGARSFRNKLYDIDSVNQPIKSLPFLNVLKLRNLIGR